MAIAKKWLIFAGVAAWAFMRAPAAAAASILPKPHSRQQVYDVYGDFAYSEADGGRIEPDPQWVDQNIVAVQLHSGQVVQLHRLIADEFKWLFERACLAASWCPTSVQTFVPRHINWDPSRNLSYHSWGIAIDLDPADNPRQGQGTMELHPDFVQVFKDAGWSWGGDWTGADRDSMHIEAVS